MPITDHVAFITGGGRGIGRAIALKYAEGGARLVLASPDVEELEETAGEINQRGCRALAVDVDVTDESQVAAAVGRARSEFGRIDVLVNNAGVAGPTAAATDVSRRDWDEVLAINLTGAFLCAKAVLPEMIGRRAGKIINISSIAGKFGYPLRSPYAASKWGLIGLTLTLAKEAGEHNVQVNAICPGPVEGPRIRAVFEGRARQLGCTAEQVEQEYVRTAVMRRLVSADDIAAMALFLASPAGDNITGQALDVSAGYGL